MATIVALAVRLSSRPGLTEAAGLGSDRRRSLNTVRKLLTLGQEAAILTSRLTSKGQTTVPKNVRLELKLQEGDMLEFELMDGYAIVRKARRPHGNDPFATFPEWAGEADQRAYADL